jgi:hypothetical protein
VYCKEALIDQLQTINNRIQKNLALFEQELKRIPLQEEKEEQEVLKDLEE